MKNLLLFPLLLIAFGVFAQRKTILLHDGSSLNGEIVRLDTVLGQTTIRMSDQTEIALPSQLIAAVQNRNLDFMVFRNGSKLLKKGRYTAVAFHLLTAKSTKDFEEKNRWGLGAHVSAGYQFNRFIAVGGGAGLDSHEEFLLPVFAEMKGYLTSAISKNPVRFPLTYGLQMGYSFPIETSLSGSDLTTKLKGGHFFYPNIGLLLPTRGGASLQFDIGYKIQRFQREIYDWWIGDLVVDKIIMRSLALRMGVVF